MYLVARPLVAPLRCAAPARLLPAPRSVRCASLPSQSRQLRAAAARAAAAAYIGDQAMIDAHHEHGFDLFDTTNHKPREDLEDPDNPNAERVPEQPAPYLVATVCGLGVSRSRRPARVWKVGKLPTRRVYLVRVTDVTVSR